MKRKITAGICTLSLASLVTSPISLCQAAAEYRNQPQTSRAWPEQAIRSSHGMVATDEQLGSQAGVEILKRGGNAVDAAVAVAFALAVVEPAAGNIGGGGFMVVRLADGHATFLDYREVAPGRATRDMYIRPDGKLDEEASVIGARSVAVPGTVAGLELALKTYGTMKLAGVMAPATGSRKKVFLSAKNWRANWKRNARTFSDFPRAAAFSCMTGKCFTRGTGFASRNWRSL
jgi:gamma-glutamyltranspeptidase/glutathione hydrolase